jgi:Flp pilus assembly protein TadD
MQKITTVVGTCCVLMLATGVLAQPPGRTDPNAERALVEYRAGWQQMQAEQYEEALRAFERALELNPKLTLAHYGKGRAYMALRRYVDATRSYVICRDDYMAQAGRKYASQVEATRVQQDRLMELRSMQQQASTGPSTTRSQSDSRLINNAVRTTEEAIQRGTSVGIDASVPAFLWVALGSAYFRSEHMEDAEKAYKQAVAVDSKAGEAHNNLAVIYLLSGRIAAAQAAVKAAEKSGFRVNPELKDEIKAAAKGSE